MSKTHSESKPDISVVLPVYNAEQTIKEAVESILKQSLSSFELIVVDDFCSDDSMAIVNTFQDKRIRVTQNMQKGVVSAANTGMQVSQTNLIARMDADDLMREHRLDKQYQYLLENSDTTLIASQVEMFPKEEIKGGFKEYMRWQNQCLSNQDVKNQIYIESPFVQPSVMFRKDHVQSVGGYKEGIFPEDYELWLRLFHNGYVMEKLDEVLLDWRATENSLSRTDESCSREAFDNIRAHYLAKDKRLQGRRFVYWGAGRKSRQRATLLIEQGFKPAAWIDIDKKKIGNEYHGARVESPEWLDHKDKPLVLNYVNNHGVRDEVGDYLESLGYKPGKDYIHIG